MALPSAASRWPSSPTNGSWGRLPACYGGRVTVSEVLRQMRCARGCGGRPSAAWLVTGPTLNERVGPRRVPLLGPEAREDAGFQALVGEFETGRPLVNIPRIQRRWQRDIEDISGRSFSIQRAYRNSARTCRKTNVMD
jgi:hypothetical protein